MSTIPDDHRPGQEDAQQGPAGVTLSSLRERYGAAWEILVHLDSSVVSAERRCGDGGQAVHYLVAHSLNELAAKLATATVAGP